MQVSHKKEVMPSQSKSTSPQTYEKRLGDRIEVKTPSPLKLVRMQHHGWLRNESEVNKLITCLYRSGPRPGRKNQDNEAMQIIMKSHRWNCLRIVLRPQPRHFAIRLTENPRCGQEAWK